MTPLTERQQRAYDFIARRLTTTAIAPTLQEIAGHLGHKSKGAAHLMVAKLIGYGHLRKLPRRHQAIELTRPTPPQRVQYFRFDDETKRFVRWP